MRAKCLTITLVVFAISTLTSLVLMILVTWIDPSLKDGIKPLAAVLLVLMGISLFAGIPFYPNAYIGDWTGMNPRNSHRIFRD